MTGSMLTTMNLLLASILAVAAGRVVVQLVRVRDVEKRVAWARRELDRAMRQLQLDDEDEVLAGLQTLGALSNRTLPPEVANRLVALALGSNARVARMARSTLERLSGGTGDDRLDRVKTG